jgi:hypothetical protein
MNDHDKLREPMWDLVYGLLSDEESSVLIARIKSDPQAARLYAEVRLQADLVAAASRVEDPSLVLMAEGPTEKLADRPVPAPRRGRSAAMGHMRHHGDEPRGGKWLAGLVGMALALLIALGYFWPQPNGQKLAQNFVVTEVEAEDVLSAGLASELKIRTRSLEGDARPAKVAVRLVDAEGRSRFRRHIQTSNAGEAAVSVPGDALEPGVHLEIDAVSGERAEDVAWDDEAERGSLHLHSQYVTSFAAELPVDPEPEVSYMLVNRPVAEADTPLEFAVWNFRARSGTLVESGKAAVVVEPETGQWLGDRIEAKPVPAIPGVVRGELPAPAMPEGAKYGLALLDTNGNRSDSALAYRNADGAALGAFGGQRGQASGETPSPYYFQEPRIQSPEAATVSDSLAKKPADERLEESSVGVVERDRQRVPEENAPEDSPAREGASNRIKQAEGAAAIQDLQLGREGPQIPESAEPAGSTLLANAEQRQPSKRLEVQLNGLQEQYQPGERVRLTLQVTDETGQPAPEALVGVRVWKWNEQVAQLTAGEPQLLSRKLRLSKEADAPRTALDRGASDLNRQIAAANMPERRKDGTATTAPRAAAPVAAENSQALPVDGEQEKQEPAEALGLSDANASGATGDPLASGPSADDSLYDYSSWTASRLAESVVTVPAKLHLSNRDAVVAEYQAALQRARQQREAAVATVGGLLLVGGAVGVVLLILLALFRMPAGARAAVPAVAIAAAGIVIGLAWVGWMPQQTLQVAMTSPSVRDPNGDSPTSPPPPDYRRSSIARGGEAATSGSAPIAAPGPIVESTAEDKTLEFRDMGDHESSRGIAPSYADARSFADTPPAGAAGDSALADAAPPDSSPRESAPRDLAKLDRRASRISEEPAAMDNEALPPTEALSPARPSARPQEPEAPPPESAPIEPSFGSRFAAGGAQEVKAKPGSPSAEEPAAEPRSVERDEQIRSAGTQRAPLTAGKNGAKTQIELFQNAEGIANEPDRRIERGRSQALDSAGVAGRAARAADVGRPHSQNAGAGGYGAGAGVSGPSQSEATIVGSPLAALKQQDGSAPASLYFNPQLLTDAQGQVTIEFDMASVASEYRLLIDALGQGRIGSAEHTLLCQPGADD